MSNGKFGVYVKVKKSEKEVLFAMEKVLSGRSKHSIAFGEFTVPKELVCLIRRTNKSKGTCLF